MTFLMRIVFLLVLLSGTAPMAPVLAQDVAENAAPAVIPGLAVERNEATVEFPDGITFTLDAETTDPITNLELLYHAPGRETLFVELPPFEAGATDLDIEHPIDLRAGTLPPGIDVQYRWRITEADGDVVETPEQTRFWVDDRFDWTPLIGPNVTVYTYDGDPAFQQEILDAAERTIVNLADAYGATLEQRVRIWAYSNREDYYGALGPNPDPHSAAVNRPNLYIVLANLPPENLDEVARVVPHEFSHQVLYQATNNAFGAPPQWLEEGLAVYWQESGRDRMYTQALELAATGEVPRLRTLNGSFPYDYEGFAASYGFSLTVVIYILDTWGEEGVSRLIDAFGEGVTFEAGVEQALGISFDELDRRWREDLLADAQQIGAAGTTRFGDDDGASPWATFGEGLALASGTLILGFAVLVAVIAGLFSFIRSRRRPDDEESIGNGPRWSEWPEGLELPRGLRES